MPEPIRVFPQSPWFRSTRRTLSERKKATPLWRRILYTRTRLSGEVKGAVIYICEESEAKAIRTLTHELLDYLVSLSITPYKAVTNALIKVVNEDAYERKEKIVEAVTRLLTRENDSD